MTIIAGINAGMGGASTIANPLLQGIMNKKNREFAARENEIMRKREDTAVQRRAADLKAAGINPMLAGLGQGAQATAGQVIAGEAPQIDTSQIIAGIQTALQSKMTNAQVKNLEADTQKKQAEKENIKRQGDQRDRELDQHDIEIQTEKERTKIQKDIANSNIKLNNNQIDKLAEETAILKQKFKQEKITTEDLEEYVKWCKKSGFTLRYIQDFITNDKILRETIYSANVINNTAENTITGIKKGIETLWNKLTGK